MTTLIAEGTSEKINILLGWGNPVETTTESKKKQQQRIFIEFLLLMR